MFPLCPLSPAGFSLAGGVLFSGVATLALLRLDDARLEQLAHQAAGLRVARVHFLAFLALFRLDIAAAFFLASALLEAPHARRDSRSLVGLPSLYSGPLMPAMRARKDARRGLSPFFTGRLRFMPCFLAERRPASFKPPFGFLPALRCHAGVLGTTLLLLGGTHSGLLLAA